MNFVDQVLGGQSSSAKVATVATMVAAVSAMAYFTFFGFGDNGKSELAPALSEEETVKIMNSIVDKIKLAVPKLIMAAENIKKQIQAQGQDIDDASLMKMFLLPQFEQFVAETQDGACNEYDVDEDELEEAVSYYAKNGHEQLIAINKQITSIYTQFGGTAADEEDLSANAAGSSELAEFTLEKVVALLGVLTEKMIAVTDRYTGNYISENGVPMTQADLERFQLGLMMETQEEEKVVVQEFGLSTTAFQSVLMRYQEAPEVQRVFMAMQTENAKLFSKHGIQMM